MPVETEKQNLIIESIEEYKNNSDSLKLVPPVLYKLSELKEKGNTYPNFANSVFHKDAKYWVLKFYKPISKTYIA